MYIRLSLHICIVSIIFYNVSDARSVFYDQYAAIVLNNNTIGLNVNTFPAVLSAGVAQDGLNASTIIVNTYYNGMGIYNQAPSSVQAILTPLTLSENTTDLTTVLGWSLNSTIIRPIHTSLLILLIATAHEVGLQAATQFLMTNYTDIANYTDPTSLVNIVTGIASYQSLPTQMTALNNSLYAYNPPTFVLDALNAGLASAQNNVAWVQQNYANLETWLNWNVHS